MDGMEEMVSRRGFAANIQTDLARADLKLRVAEFLGVTALSVMGFFIAARIIFGSALLALVFGVIGFFVPRIYVRHAKETTPQRLQRPTGRHHHPAGQLTAFRIHHRPVYEDRGPTASRPHRHANSTA